MNEKGNPPALSPTMPFFSIDLDLAQAVIDSLDLRVIIIDSNHMVVLINKVALREFSINPRDVIGQKCPHFQSNSDCPVCPLNKATQLSSTQKCEFFDNATNRWFHSLISPLPLITRDGFRTFMLIVTDITDKKNAQTERDDLIRKYGTLSNGTIEAIHNIVDSRDAYVGAHQKEVARLVVAIAQEMGLDSNITEGLKISAMIHDVGKIAIPSDILLRPGKLTKDEYAIIKTHPKEGYELLRNIDFPYPLAEIVYQHHERIDGSGYPRSLTGPEILIEAKIIAVAEVVEAMTSHRPHRPALSLEKALIEIETKSGKSFDPKVVNACLRLFRNKGYQLKKEGGPE